MRPPRPLYLVAIVAVSIEIAATLAWLAWCSRYFRRATEPASQR